MGSSSGLKGVEQRARDAAILLGTSALVSIVDAEPSDVDHRFGVVSDGELTMAPRAEADQMPEIQILYEDRLATRSGRAVPQPFGDPTPDFFQRFARAEVEGLAGIPVAVRIRIQEACA